MEIVFFRILTAVGLLYFLRTHALRETISSKDVRKCFVPKDSGSCKRFVLAFYFNERKHRCLAFAYGGCGGNGNNFHKKKECEELCIPGSQPPRPPQPPVYNSPEDPFDIDFCSPGKDPGKCKAYFPRYYYNEETRECERFIYGGCGGNKNNFHNKSDCEKECVPTFDPIVLN